MPRCSMLPCDTYDYQKVYDTLAQTVENLGGFAPYIAPGERVLLKANLLMKKRPEEVATTHPTFVKALANLLIEYGATVIIGDSPGGPFTPGLVNGIYKATGMEAVAQETGAALNANYGSFQKENPKGLIMKRLTLTDMLNDVDKVISVSKLKTHAMMTFTGAVKNMFGTVPGITKAQYHLNMPNYEHFADMLIDVCLCAAPVLSFMDGIIGMEGHGPSAGTPAPTHVVLASDCPYHLDLAACHVIGLGIEEVPILKQAAARGLLGTLEDIDFTGDPPDSFVMSEYEIIRGRSPLNLHGSNMPAFMKRFVARHMQSRPIISDTICNGCAACKEACPAEIITINDKRKARIDFAECIRCYCCQELCPRKAIKVFKPGIVRLLRL